MDYNNITAESIHEAIVKAFRRPQQRTMRMYTGIGGYDNLLEAQERYIGYKRVYIGKKVPRLLKKLNFKVKKSLVGRYYKLIPTHAKNTLSMELN